MKNTEWHDDEIHNHETISSNVWKSEDVFQEQLQLNIKQLKKPKEEYPSHWLEFFAVMDSIEIPKEKYKFLDVGCGCGSYIDLCKNYNVSYHGVDFSPMAITIAKKAWENPSSFSVGDYKDLSSESIKDVDILHLGALLDVLPSGDEAFKFILNLNVKHLILGRVHFTNEKSKSYTLKAYLGKTFVRYEHNKTNFYQELDKRKIEYKQFGTTLYIKGKDE